MFKYLEKVHKNMEWIAIMSLISIKINNKTKLNDKINMKEYFDDDKIITLIISVLFYIRDKTLLEEIDCTTKNISLFIEDLIYLYCDKELNKDDIYTLTKFIIIEVLQNNGKLYEFKTLNYNTNSEHLIKIKLLESSIIEGSQTNEVTYLLSKQGFEFLFRIDDIEDELEISIEQIRLEMLLKNKKFGKAKEQCKAIIGKIRHKRKDIQILLKRMKENINNVSLEDCQNQISSTFDLLKIQYKQYNKLYTMIKKIEDDILDNLEYDKENEKLLQYKKDIEDIKKDMNVIIHEYATLLETQQPVFTLFEHAIKSSINNLFKEKIDIEKDLLEKFENINSKDIIENKLLSIFNPLFKPAMKKNYNILSIYNAQDRIEELINENNKNIIETIEIDTEYEEKKQRELKEALDTYNLYLITMMDIFLETDKEIFLSDMLEILKNKNKDIYKKISEDENFYKTLLQIYNIRTINIEKILQENKNDTLQEKKDKNFDINYTVGEICKLQKYQRIKEFTFNKVNEDTITIPFTKKYEEYTQKTEIVVTNFKIEVKK